MKNNYYYDVVIIGSGAAGLTTALNLAKLSKVAILTKGELNENNTMHAQGGIAAVVSSDDSIESHIKDTLICGDGLCDEAAVRFVISNAKAAIDWLVEQGVKFNLELSEQGKFFHLTQEGGHSCRRVLHTNDATGLEIGNNLIRQVQDQLANIRSVIASAAKQSGAPHNDENMDVFTQYTAIDLIIDNNQCVGLYALNNNTQEVEIFSAKFVVLATGGASKVYKYTSNPDCATGDGIAMAFRAGCKIKNMEFSQFHPTCLYHSGAKSFLITEALRGEGAILTLPDGERFMVKFDVRGELAPRDIVARAIDHEMSRLGIDFVYLDISHKPAAFITQHFPTVYKTCLEFGFDITKQAIPVTPAAHYTCGGVVVDQLGRTNINGLYAIGEASCSGLHGANRIASNSLLECIVYGRAVGEDINKNMVTIEQHPKDRYCEGCLRSNSEEIYGLTHPMHSMKGVMTEIAKQLQVFNVDELGVIKYNCTEVRDLMWNYVGIVRSNKKLERAQVRIELLKSELDKYYANFKINQDLIELRNLITIADLIISAAILRGENYGLHYNLDFGVF